MKGWVMKWTHRERVRATQYPLTALCQVIMLLLLTFNVLWNVLHP